MLFLDYLRSGGLALSPPLRSLAVLALTAALTYLNYRGLHLVGLSALFLTAFSLSPFVTLTMLAIDPRGYFNSMFWNLKARTLAGEVDEPRKTFPKAVFCAVGLVVGALPAETAAEWTDGFFSLAGAPTTCLL